jgi:hypothetical protein
VSGPCSRFSGPVLDFPIRGVLDLASRVSPSGPRRQCLFPPRVLIARPGTIFLTRAGLRVRFPRRTRPLGFGSSCRLRLSASSSCSRAHPGHRVQFTPVYAHRIPFSALIFPLVSWCLTLSLPPAYFCAGKDRHCSFLQFCGSSLVCTDWCVVVFLLSQGFDLVQFEFFNCVWIVVG